MPLAQASEAGGDVAVPDDRQLVNDAPQIDPDQHLSEAEEQIDVQDEDGNLGRHEQRRRR